MKELISLKKDIVNDKEINVQSKYCVFFLVHSPKNIETKQEVKNLLVDYVKFAHRHNVKLRNLRNFRTDLIALRYTAENDYQTAKILYSNLKVYVNKMIDKGFYCGKFIDDEDYKKACDIKNKLDKIMFYRLNSLYRYNRAISKLTDLNELYIDNSTCYLNI